MLEVLQRSVKPQEPSPAGTLHVKMLPPPPCPRSTAGHDGHGVSSRTGPPPPPQRQTSVTALGALDGAGAGGGAQAVRTQGPPTAASNRTVKTVPLR